MATDAGSSSGSNFTRGDDPPCIPPTGLPGVFLGLGVTCEALPCFSGFAWVPGHEIEWLFRVPFQPVRRSYAIIGT